MLGFQNIFFQEPLQRYVCLLHLKKYTTGFLHHPWNPNHRSHFRKYQVHFSWSTFLSSVRLLWFGAMAPMGKISFRCCKRKLGGRSCSRRAPPSRHHISEQLLAASSLNLSNWFCKERKWGAKKINTVEKFGQTKIPKSTTETEPTNQRTVV